MNTIKIFSIALLAVGFTVNAQDIDSAKKAIDAEQYEKAKGILKAVVAAKPDNGKAIFLLGNVYLKQNTPDSAKIYFQKGLIAKEFGAYNYIGLGQIELDNDKVAAAQVNFDLATKDAKKKDFEQYLYIGKAFTNSEKPDFKKAVLALEKGKLANPTNTEILVALGDAHYGNKSQNDAYPAYDNAIIADPTLLRPKMQLGVLLKGARQFNDAKAKLNEVATANPNYGPVYRELAETFYLSGNFEKGKYKEYTAKALEYYEKYMSLTDYSLTSRMRHADFLVIAKDYVALEKEAEAMKKLDKVNPRIYRYLGYSAFENGNNEAALTALQNYMAEPTNKVIGRDYLYLAKAQLKKAMSPAAADGKVTLDDVIYKTALTNLDKAVELDKNLANDYNDIAIKLFDLKLYKYAAGIYEIAIKNPASKNYKYDNFLLGYSLYFENADKEAGKINFDALKRADKAFEDVITAAPTTADAHLYKARVNGMFENDSIAQEKMAKSYEDYVKVITDKGVAELDKPANKTKFVEAYQTLAKYYAKKDKVKATEFISKALVIEPTNSDTITLQKALK